MQQNKEEIEWVDDRIFTPYICELIIKTFQDHTGYNVSKKQENELRKFLYSWSLECLKDVKNAD